MEVIVRPLDGPDWIRRVVGAPVDGDELGSERAMNTTSGYPLLVVETLAGPTATVHGFYYFLDYAAHVSIAGEPPVVTAHRREIIDALVAATPDFWTGEIVALAQLWSAP